MESWILWAFFAPMVTLISQPCGWVLMGAFISYGLLSLTLSPRRPQVAGIAIGAGLLTVLVALSLITLAAGPIVQQLSLLRRLAAIAFIISGLLALTLKAGPGDLMLGWNYLFGGVYALGVLSCGPIFATVGSSAHLEGWAGFSQLAAYALGLLVGSFVLFIIAASAQLLLVKLLGPRLIRLLGALGLIALGALRYWS